MQKKHVFITGIVGFIGFHLTQALLKEGHQVSGIDDFNDYYSPALKNMRAKILQEKGATIARVSLNDTSRLQPELERAHPTHIVHLAAQPSVHCKNPHQYIESNITGFHNLLTLIKERQTPLIFASSSSVYGNNTDLPFTEDEKTDHPNSLYGATKKSGELIAYAYHHAYQIPMIGLRFFTVYGPYGRPDMAYFSFTDKILKGEPITVYGEGKLQRDFTYIDDLIRGIQNSLDAADGFEIFNLGGEDPQSLHTLISCIEQSLGKTASIDYKEKPPEDVPITYADIEKAKNRLGFTPTISLKEGIQRFVDWRLETLDQF